LGGAGGGPWPEDDQPSTGFVCLHASALESPALRDPRRFRAWCWLLMEAAPAAYTVRINRRSYAVPRGDVMTSEAKLAAAWGMTRPAVQRFLAALERQGMIRRESGRFGTRITLVGYDEDQPAAGDEADQ
jgi:hypothetical protein